MVANKHITKIAVAVMAVAVALCLVAVAFSGTLSKVLGGKGVKMEYETKLFDTDTVMSIDIQMDEDSWNEMLENALTEEYYVCDVVINGKTVKNTAIRPKGNTSLSAIAMDPDTDRYSLKLEFDHFVEGQTCYGLDKLILNNNYADATNMKEAIIYDMYGFLGADASLYNYAEVSVNGEYWGVYLALEAVEQSFMLRNFGTQDGELYKPDSMEMGGGDSSSSAPASPGSDSSESGSFQPGGMTPPSGGFPGRNSDGAEETDESAASENESSGRPSFGDFTPPDMPEDFDFSNMPGGFSPGDMPSDFDPSSIPEGFNPGNMPGASSDNSGSEDGEENSSDKSSSSGRRGSSGKGGANLNYTDDDLDSYSTIWEGEITGTSKGDHRRVVTALKNISEGTDLEEYLDIDNILKYMAVHVFSVNMDSLSGSMAHNYYLYEYEGQLNLFPWDYNLALGGMSMGGDASSMINDAIDTPFSGTQFFDALLENEEYLEQYHSYLRQLVEEYVFGGRFDEVYERITSQIDYLVETDPTAFYTYEEYQTASQMLYKTVQLRAQSIQGQLDGTIPSTDEGQREDSSALIDASGIDVKAMGQFSMGGGGGFSFGGRSGKSSEETDSADSTEAGESKTEPETETKAEEKPEETSPSNPSGDSDRPEPPDGFDPSNMPDDFDPGNMQGGFDPSNLPDDFNPGNMPDRDSFNQGNMSGMSLRGKMAESSEAAEAEEEQSAEQSDSQSESADDSEGEESQGGGRQAPSFPGSPGQSDNSAKLKNLAVYGICLAFMLVLLVAVKLIKRRR